MKSFLYEWKKVFSIPAVRYGMGLLLVLYTAVCAFSVQLQPHEVPGDIMDNFYSLYAEDPETVEAVNEELQLWYQMQSQMEREAKRSGNSDYHPEPFPNHYGTDKYGDSILFRVLFTQKNYVTSYPSKLAAVVEEAVSMKNSVLAMGIPESSYAVQYQENVIRIYTDLGQMVRLGFEDVRGWNTYFSYEPLTIFLFLAVIIVSSVIGLYDHSCGTLPILRTVRHGRLRLMGAKIAAAASAAVALTAVYVLVTVTVIGIVRGYSSPFNAVQVISEYLYCPWNISVIECFFLDLLVKIVLYAVFSLFMLAAASLVKHYVVTFLIGVGAVGIGFGLAQLRYLWMNLLSVTEIASGEIFWTRYRAVNFFGAVVPAVPFCTAVLALAAAACVRFLVLTEKKTGLLPVRTVKSLGQLLHLPQRRRKETARRPVGVYSRSLFGWELTKRTLSRGIMVLLLALFVTKGVLDRQAGQLAGSFTDAVYREYMTRLEGEMTDEKRAYLASERKRMSDATNGFSKKQEAYLNKELSVEEFRVYLDEYNYAASRKEIFGMIEEHARYIDRLADEGEEAWFLYDTGWEYLFFSDFDWTLYAALILLTADVFSMEYDSSSSRGLFAGILRVTKRGRRESCAAKYLSALASAAVFTLLWNAADLVTFAVSYGLPRWDAPVRSMEIMETLGAAPTVGGYWICLVLVRLAASVALAALVCSLSLLLRRRLSVIAVAAVVTLLPMLLAKVGAEIFSVPDFTEWMRGTPLLLRGGTGVLFIAVFAAAVLALTAYAVRLWTHGDPKPRRARKAAAAVS